MNDDIARPMEDVLDCAVAVAAADAAAQAVFGAWSRLTPAQRQEWKAMAPAYWPRRDIQLAVFLEAASRIVELETAAEETSG